MQVSPSSKVRDLGVVFDQYLTIVMIPVSYSVENILTILFNQ